MPIDEDPIQVLADLRPTATDDIAASSYARRREHDLARVLAIPAGSPVSQPRSRWRHPGLLGGAVGLTAAAAAVAVVLSSVPAGPHQAGRGRSVGRPVAATLSARTVLLASAESAARASAATGSYWYVDERDVVRVPALATHDRKIPVPFTAYVADGEQSWYPARGGVSRTVTGIGYRLIFASAADEGKWRAMGSPDISVGYPARPTTSDYRFPGGVRVPVGNHQLTLAQLERLPKTVAGLEKTLRGFWATDAVTDPNGGSPVRSAANFTGFVWAAAQELLTSSATPGTKAALFRLLAAQPGITARQVTDDLGRGGVSLSVVSGGEQFSLIVAPSTGQLLAFESRPAAGAANVFDVSMTFQRTGWTRQLGVPASS